MPSQTERIKRKLREAESRPIMQEEAREERLNEKLPRVSLQEVPLEVRRKEAKEPLYLIRYE